MAESSDLAHEGNLRRSGPEDTAGISRLLASTFPNNPKSDPDVLNWQYWDAPFGKTISWVWSMDEEIVCHLAHVALPLIADGKRILGSMTIDAATAPRFRERGLYQVLRESCTGDARRSGMELGLDFRASRTRLPSGSAQGVDEFVRYAVPLRARWLADRLHVPAFVARGLLRVARPPPGHANELDEVPDDIQDLWDRISRPITFGIDKNEQWWNWRYAGHPHRPYRYFALREGGSLVAAAATLPRPTADVLAVLDLFAKSPGAAATLVGGIARATDAGALAFLATRPAHRSDLARAGGVRPVPGLLDRERVRLHVRNISGRHPEALTARWAVTWGDMDYL